MKYSPLVAALFATPCVAAEYIVKSDAPLFRTAALGLSMQYASQQTFNEAALLCPSGFDIKEQLVRFEDGHSVLYWRIACSSAAITQSVPPATPGATAPSESR